MQREMRDQWLSEIRHFVRLEEDALSLFRKRGWERFLDLGLPLPKDEAFQYVRWEGAPTASSEQLTIEGTLSSLSLSDAMRTYGLYLQNRMARSLKEESDPFAALNGALFEQGSFLYAPPGVEGQFQVRAQGVAPRIHLHVGRGAKVQLLWEREMSVWSTSLLDAVVEEGGELQLVEISDEPAAAGAFHAIRITQKRSSKSSWFQIGRGGTLARTSVKIQLTEEDAEAQITALALLDQSGQNHLHASVEHQAPHCRSRQHVKGALRDLARSSFEGKILVRSPAQKTESYQLCNHLLLSPQAMAFAKPNLEIFADDVKASHGATVAELPKEELFYLESRGIDKEEGKRLLLEGFLFDLVAKAPFARREIEAAVSRYLA